MTVHAAQYNYFPDFLVNAFSASKIAGVKDTYTESSSSSSIESPTLILSTPDRTGLFSAPKLTSPEHRLIHLLEEMDDTGKKLMHFAGEELNFLTKQTNQHFEEKSLLLQTSAKRAQELGNWEILEQIGSCLLASFNIFYGTALALTGAPALGTTLIAAGMLSMTSIAITELKGWDFITQRLAQDNEELQNQLLFWSPLALNTLSMALSAACYGGLFGPTLWPLQSDKYIQGAIGLYSGVSTSGKSLIEARHNWTKADLSEIRGKIDLDTAQKENLLAFIENYVKNLHNGWEEAKNMIQISIQTRVTS